MHFEDITTVSNADLPSAELADYLQLQSDATGAVRQNQHLDSSLKAALHEVESRTGRFLLQKNIEIKTKYKPCINFNIGKADNVQINQVYFDLEEPSYLTEDEYIYLPSNSTSKLEISVPAKAEDVVVRLSVGQQHWDDVVADLKMAVITLSAYYYEQRYDQSKSNIGMPKLVEALIEKHRTIRI